MSNLELLALEWAERGWLALLAFTAAALAVAVLRRPCRRWFGAERAFQLWLLPPLVMLASQLPHAAASATRLPMLLYTITAAAGTPASHANPAGAFDWRTAALLLWSCGVVCVLVVAVQAQRRYGRRLRDATPMADASSRWPVLRAGSNEVGPALVGAWRSRIVLPADFHECYDAAEQVLILAHEAVHARRGDGWWSLFAQTLATLLWCNPLAWWALAALRHDQELACDAAVLREHGAQRRSYANAMLKTQSAVLALPVGCAWSPRHPLTERIAMLKQPVPGRFRRLCGSLIVFGAVWLIAGGVYAATLPASPANGAGPTNLAKRYTLKLVVGIGSEPPRYRGSMCLKPGQFYDVTEGGLGKRPPWRGRFTVVAAEKGKLEVQGTMSGGWLTKPVNPRLLLLPGQQGGILMDVTHADKDGKQAEDGTIRIELTPSIGC